MRSQLTLGLSLLFALLAGCAGDSKQSPSVKMSGSVSGPGGDMSTSSNAGSSAASSSAGSSSQSRPRADAGVSSPKTSDLIASTGSDSGAAIPDTSTPMPDAGAPMTQLPDAFAEAICDAMLACIGKSALRELTSGEDCVTRIAAELRATEFAYMDEAIAASRVLYSSSQLPACENGIRALGCDVLSHSFPAPCVEVLTGTVKLGAACSISAECEGTAFCAGSEACPSICAPLLAAGDACSGDNQCGDDLMCVAGHCLRPSVAGEPCSGTSGKVCRLGFNCSGSTDTQIGKCVDNASVQIGDKDAACEPGGSLCKDGVSCVFDGTSGFHCEGPVPSGAACHLGLPKQCPGDEYCDTTDATTLSTCKKLPQAGKPCALGRLCAAGSACVSASASSGVCRAIQPNGGACGSDAECRSSTCTGGACVPPPVCK